MDGVEESEKLVPKCVVTHKEEAGAPSTHKEVETEHAPLITKQETVVPSTDDAVVQATEKKKGAGFMASVGSAQRQQQQQQHQLQKQQSKSGPLKIAVFIKKPIQKDRRPGDGKFDPGNMYELKLDKKKSTTAGDIKDIMLANLQIEKESAHLFAIWFISPHLELQIKPHHKPFQLRKKWTELLATLSDCSKEEAHLDEPVVVFQRNSFISIAEEKKEDQEFVLKRLFEEASFNVLNSRYRLPILDAIRLGAILLRLNQQKDFDPNLHGRGFFKSQGLKLTDFLPYYAIGSNKVSQYIHSSNSEIRLLQQYQGQKDKLTDNLSCYKMFLDYCQNLPFYGAAFFKGSCYQEGIGYRKWKSEKQPVTVAINCYGITIFKGESEEVLSHLSHSSFYWDCKEDDEVDENGVAIKQFIIEYEDSNQQTRLIQINSKQAGLMDAMVQSFANVSDKDGEIDIPEDHKTDLSKLNSISYTRPQEV